MRLEWMLRVLRNSHTHERKELQKICFGAPRCLPTNEWPEVDFTGHGACYHLFAREDLQREQSCEVVLSLDVWQLPSPGLCSKMATEMSTSQSQINFTDVFQLRMLEQRADPKSPGQARD